MTTLVLGATGTVGKSVLANLAAKGEDVRGMTRYEAKLDTLPQGATGCVADLMAMASLKSAFDGVDKVFMITPLSQNEIQMGRNTVTAAKAAGVKHIVYMSVPMPEGTEKVPHFRNKTLIERTLKDSGIPVTILRANNFFQNDLWGQAAIMGYSTYPQPIGNLGLNRVDSRDVADAAVTALTQAGFEGQDIAIHGPDTLTGDGVASIFTQQLGKMINYAGDDLDSWAQQSQHMMPTWMVSDFKLMYQFFQTHGLKATAEELEKQEAIIGHPPRSFKAFVEQVAKNWAE